MNLFRSEEHIRNWSGFKPGTEGGIVRLPDLVTLFSGPLFTRRLDADYASRTPEYLGQLVSALKELGPFWQPPEG